MKLLQLACVLIFAFTTVARGQTAPEGNAHPSTQAVNESGMGLASPFGPAVIGGPVVGEAEKVAFAAAVDLTPLRDLAVFHNGRVKILDTLARETVQRIVGRHDYQDFIEGTKSGYDPLFTLLDMTIDPAYYFDKPLIGVEYLPLRRVLMEGRFENEGVREAWLKRGRVTPRMVEAAGPGLAQRDTTQAEFSLALNRLDSAVRLFAEGKSNYAMVAPATRDAPWTHISQLPEEHPARKAAAELGAGWRARDAARVNAAAAQLSAELPRISTAVYPASRRALELTYNRANAFEWGVWAYALALVTLLLAFGTGRGWLARVGAGFLLVSLGLHAFGFVVRCIIAERFAIQNQFESMTGLSLFATVVGAGIMLARRQWLFGAAAAAVGFLMLITATQTKIPGVAIEREAAILNTSVLLKYHVTTVLSSYGLISLGFVLSLFYLGAHYFAKGPALGVALQHAGPGGDCRGTQEGDRRGTQESIGTKARLLADLDTAQLIVLQLAFWTLGVGILLGAWWADHSWGRWWAFDPKETWALITWIVYLVVIHTRVANPGRKGVTTAWLSLAGFVVMLWTYFGVNLLLPGLHAYA